MPGVESTVFSKITAEIFSKAMSVCFLFTGIELLAQDQDKKNIHSDWNHLYTTSEISVFQSKTDYPYTYMAQGLLKGNILEVLAVLADAQTRTEWFENLEKFEVLSGEIEGSSILYEKYTFPWPAWDRDIVTLSKVYIDYKKKEVSVEFQSTKFKDKPPLAGIVRMPKTKGTMFFKFHDQHHTYTRNTLMLDVGGNLPDWVVSQVVKKIPYQTVYSLEQRIVQMKGKYDEFITKHKKLIDSHQGDF